MVSSQKTVEDPAEDIGRREAHHILTHLSFPRSLVVLEKRNVESSTRRKREEAKRKKHQVVLYHEEVVESDEKGIEMQERSFAENIATTTGAAVSISVLVSAVVYWSFVSWSNKQMDDFFNRKLRQAREARGWRQVDLAQQLRVDRSTVIRWERGAQPLPNFVEKLCSLFGMQKSELGLQESALRKRKADSQGGQNLLTS